VHWSFAWVAAAAATVTTAVQDEGAAMAALSRTATAGLGQSKSARVTAAVAVAAEANAMALAGVSTAASKGSVAGEPGTTSPPLKESNKGRSKGRQVESRHCSYLSFLCSFSFLRLIALGEAMC
jgi:hypothetical protein